MTLIGTDDALDEVTRAVGDTACNEHLEFDISQYDKRRIFVSSPQISGRRLRDLDIIGHYGALVTRIRRGDVELLPHGETVLMPGDQVRVVAPHEQMDAADPPVWRLLPRGQRDRYPDLQPGYSARAAARAGPHSTAGRGNPKTGHRRRPADCGAAGRRLGRTGTLVWNIPYSANLTLRQIGLVFFLAGMGTRAGYAFISTLTQGSGLVLFGAGAVITCTTALAVLWVGYKLLHIPMGLLVGILAGLQTQPALLGFGLEQADNELPNVGYSTVYPTAMIAKILLAQLILVFFL